MDPDRDAGQFWKLPSIISGGIGFSLTANSCDSIIALAGAFALHPDKERDVIKGDPDRG